MEPKITSTYSDIATTTRLDAEGLGLLDSIFNRLSGSDVSSSFSFDKILNILNTVWLGYVVLAYLFCILLLVIYVFASTRKKQLEVLALEMSDEYERIYEENFKTGPKNNRIEDMLNHVSSDSPNDWKLAIIEADIVLDEILKEAGYAGVSLGERLKSISPTQLQSLDDAWEAHKVRNRVAHGGADFILTHRLAQDTIKQYRRVFHELGVR